MINKNLAHLGFIALLLASCGQQTSTTKPDPMVKNDQPTKIVEKPVGLMQKTSYIVYSPEVYAQTKDQKRILFFKANWCPTCNTADKDFMDNIGKIPEGVTLFQVDYDKESELKQKYAITYQHTFVQVDTSDREIAKWNGGGVDKLLTSIK